MAYNKSERPDSPMKRRGGRRRKKVCVFCGKENNEIDYKDVNKLKRYVSERGKSFREESQELCKTSESSDSSYQESTSHRSYAIRSGLIKFENIKIIKRAANLSIACKCCRKVFFCWTKQ